MITARRAARDTQNRHMASIEALLKKHKLFLKPFQIIWSWWNEKISEFWIFLPYNGRKCIIFGKLILIHGVPLENYFLIFLLRMISTFHPSLLGCELIGKITCYITCI